MIEFKLPSLGADMDDGTLLEWKVGVGDTVTKGQVIAVVNTAKAAVDVECWTPGTVHELVAEVGQKMPLGTRRWRSSPKVAKKSALAGRRRLRQPPRPRAA